jgi:hypothetical protein
VADSGYAAAVYRLAAVRLDRVFEFEQKNRKTLTGVETACLKTTMSTLRKVDDWVGASG